MRCTRDVREIVVAADSSDSPARRVPAPRPGLARSPAEPSGGASRRQKGHCDAAVTPAVEQQKDSTAQCQNEQEPLDFFRSSWTVCPGLDHPDTLTYEHNLAATCLVEHGFKGFRGDEIM